MKEAKVLRHDPLAEADEILEKDFYGRAAEPRPATGEQPVAAAPDAPPARKKKKPKPTHYKVVCISMYTKDIEQLEAKVAELKRRGHTRANKSQLIRFALSQVDIDKVPPTI